MLSSMCSLISDKSPPPIFFHTDHIQAAFAHCYVLLHRSLLHIKLYHMDNLSIATPHYVV